MSTVVLHTHMTQVVDEMTQQERRRNRRTAWILASIVAAFFVGIILKRSLFS